MRARFGGMICELIRTSLVSGTAAQSCATTFPSPIRCASILSSRFWSAFSCAKNGVAAAFSLASSSLSGDRSVGASPDCLHRRAGASQAPRNAFSTARPAALLLGVELQPRLDRIDLQIAEQRVGRLLPPQQLRLRARFRQRRRLCQSGCGLRQRRIDGGIALAQRIAARQHAAAARRPRDRCAAAPCGRTCRRGWRADRPWSRRRPAVATRKNRARCRPARIRGPRRGSQ